MPQINREVRVIKIRKGEGESIEEFGPSEFVEEKELKDGTIVMTIRIPGERGEQGSSPLAPAAGVSGAISDLEQKLAEFVRSARAQGSTWTDIGAALGVSKQAAWERFSGEE